MNFVIILTGIVGLIEAFLALIVFIRDYRNQANRAFALFSISVISWVVAIIFYYTVHGKDAIWFWTRILYVGPLFIPTSLVYFIYVFLDGIGLEGMRNRKKIILTILFIPNIIFAFLTFFSHVFLQDVIINKQTLTIIYHTFGRFYFIYAIYYISYFLWTYIILLKNFSADRLKNAQIFYILAGSFSASIIGMISNLILPYYGSFEFFWIGPASTLVFGVFILYAIIVHHILNINIVSTEIFIGILMILLLVNVFTFNSSQDLLFKSSIFGGGIVIAFLLIIKSLRELRHSEQIEALNSQLQKSINELRKIDELKTEFVSLASHQLRTPLTPIKGFSDMLLEGSVGRGPITDEEQKDAIKMINESANRMANLIDDILDVSKLEKEGGFTYTFQLVNPEEIVKKIVDDFTKQANDKGLELLFNSTISPAAKIKLDPAKFIDAVGNLISNAVKYTIKGTISVSVSENGGEIVISVKDTGVGIERDDMPRLFQKFFRGKEMARLDAEGTGLGLYFTRHVIEDHSGRITVQSDGPQKGSEFIVRLPKALSQPIIAAEYPQQNE